MRTAYDYQLVYQRSLLLAFGMIASMACSALSPANQHSDSDMRLRLSANYGQLPLAFEANAGQAAKQVRFLARGQGYGLFLTPNEAVLSLRASTLCGSAEGARSGGCRAHFDPAARGKRRFDESTASTPSVAVIHMALAGANRAPRLSGIDPLTATSNYFIGNDPARWHTAVPNYAKVKYSAIYPGIDLVYYGNQRQVEYDFIVAPGADPKRIVLDFTGARKLSLNAAGDLVLATVAGNITQHKPAVYQDIDGTRREIDGHYVLQGKRRASFDVGAYDRTRTLIIDPVLTYSTFLGGSGHDRALSIAVDGSGNAYVAGWTTGSDFPTTRGAYQANYGGAPAFVAKLNASGTALIYSTYLGGSGNHDQAWGIAVDSSGDAYVGGVTESSDFPITAGAYQTSFAGGGDDAFITKLNATGTALVYSTYLGGRGEDFAIDIAVDGSRNAYVTGRTTSTNFPTTRGALQNTFGGGLSDGFITKLNAEGTALVYSTYIGGSGSANDFGHGIAVDVSGNAYVVGLTSSSNFPTTPGAYQTRYGGGPYDAFVTKLNAAGTGFVYSTFLGGSGDDEAFDVAVDGSANAYVTGATSGNFPTTAGVYQTMYGGGAFDGFVTKLNAAGTALVYSTYLGGSGNEGGIAGIAVDSGGNAYITGATSGDFPTTAGAFQSAFGGGARSDGFLTQLNADGTALLYSTYFGGDRDDWPGRIAVDGSGNAYVAGFTGSSNFPTTADAYQTSFGGDADGFVVRFSGMSTGPTPTTVDVIEFYHPLLDHYFISSLQADIESLDSGRFPGWVRTGYTFKAYPAPANGTNPVCRFYLPPPFGDSHFFSASLSECAQVLRQYPGFDYESPNVMYIRLPDQVTGECSADTVPVYRLWDKRIDTNHRYTSDRAVRDQMLGLGWVLEGYGAAAPNLVIMCAPSS